MSDLDGYDAFDKLLDRVCDLAGATDKAEAVKVAAQDEVRALKGELASAQAHLRLASEQSRTCLREGEENSELWVAAKELDAKIAQVLSDSGITAPSLFVERERLKKAIDKTRERLDPIPF